MSLILQTEDQYIYDKQRLIMYLYDCLLNNKDAVVDFAPEGPCAESVGLYEILDRFCSHTGYDPRRITIATCNMLEDHPVYKISRRHNYWFEIKAIQRWYQTKTLNITYTPELHFGSFVGQSRWPRVWLSAWMWKNHRERTLQTFNTSLKGNYRTPASSGTYDWIGLEDLIRHDCDIMPDVINFLSQCPIVIEEDIKKVKETPIGPEQTDRYYPLQHPANLNIIHFYNNFFVDLILESMSSGTQFLATEKMWRCVLAHRPFIVMGPRDYLHNLRQLGFKTFHDYWDEDYDGQSNQDRIKLIQTQIDMISQWPKEKLHSMLEDMKPILEHNYNVFLNLNHDVFIEKFKSE